jgi:hypothetical protein
VPSTAPALLLFETAKKSGNFTQVFVSIPPNAFVLEWDQIHDAEGQFPLKAGTLCYQFGERFEGLMKGQAHVLKVWFWLKRHSSPGESLIFKI